MASKHAARQRAVRESRRPATRLVPLGVLAALAAVALVWGLVLGAGHHHEDAADLAPPPPTPVPTATPQTSAKDVRPLPTPATAAVDRLPLARQVGELIVLRFRGPAAPLYVRRILGRGWAAGAILFHDNIAAPGQLRALTRSLRAAAKGYTPIICSDQEGGSIRNITWAPPVAAQAAQNPGPDARAAGRALRAAGLNVTLAPVADVPSVPDAALAGRAFSGDPRRTATAVAAAVRGWTASGVAPTVKHFPGLGGTTVNTDHGSTAIGGGAPTARDLAPFRAAIAAGAPIVMAAHARDPALDADHIASQSHAIVSGLLRRGLGFKGVVMTDSMEAAAVRATGSLEQAAIRSVEAGDDILLTTGQGSWNRVYRALLGKAQASKAFRTRVRESAARVLALQRTLD
jgi:beta-N-acetylhexosaminidase